MDVAHKETDKILENIEKRLRKEYRQATKEVEQKLDNYFAAFRRKDEKKRALLDAGEITQKEYNDWRYGQMCVGKRWEDMRDKLAADLANTDAIARNIADGYMPEVYAVNHNFATYQIETGARLDTSYTLYDAQTVERLVRDNPDVLPQIGRTTQELIDKGVLKKWNMKNIQSTAIQGILQGESITKLAKRMANDVGASNYKDCVRHARTMTTATQNAGRVDGFKRANDMGVDVMQEWVATIDGRTRHEHRILDGQRRKVGEPFEVEGEKIMYPADPTAPYRLIMNCRCTLIGQIKGFERNTQAYREDKDLDGMTYEEWKQAKAPKKAEAVIAPSDITTRQQALDALSSVFGSVESNVKVIPDELLIENVNQLMKLNERFGALTDNNTGYFTTSPSKKALAWTSTQYRKNGSTNLSLVGKAFKDAKTVEDGFKKYRDSLWNMPADDKYAHTYSVTHEYGHILESFISRKRTTWGGILGDDYVDDPKKEEKKQAKKIAKEIIQIAKDNNHDFVFADNISRYGCTNDYEFFAEVFANSQCGKPNELGLAMQKWLKQEGF